jgi:signal transduction histidine kinase
MPVRTALDALTMRPTRFLRSWWPWRSALYLASSVVPLTPVVVLLVLVRPAPALVVVLLAAVPVGACGVSLARFERWRSRLVEAESPVVPVVAGGWRGRLRDEGTWRAVGYSLFSAAALWWMDLVVVGCMTWFPVTFLVAPLLDEDGWAAAATVAAGVVLLVVAPYPITAWAGARAAMTQAVLAPHRLVEVARSRARLVDAFESERRRIERDLHDGAQQRLIALNVHLGLARLDVAPGSPLDQPLRTAHDLAKQALGELRELIRGVHPQVLRDRGLAAAVADVAARSPVPVDVDVRLPHRLPQTIEVAAYFVVVEALANVARHSAASRASVSAFADRDRVELRVTDDGIGGADPAAGTGLVGLADRVAAADGTLAVSSPAGGPTVLRARFDAR